MREYPHIDPTSARILRVLDYVYANTDGDLSLDRLADVAALSRFHFHRVFRAITGETVAQAVRRVRMNRAATMLVQSEDAIAAIATSCGYPNGDSFARAFQGQFGLTPAAFRARGAMQVARTTLTERTTHMTYPVEIRDLPTHRLATVDHVGPYPEIPKAFDTISALMTARGLWPHGEGMVGIYFDDPATVPAAKLRSKACVIVDEACEIAPPMSEYILPAGEHAVLTYTGPYSGLPTAYDQIYGQWLPESGRELHDLPCWERSLNSPMDTAPENLITETCVPLKPA